MFRKFFACLAVTALVAGTAQAQLTVDEDLGTLGAGTTSVSNNTAGQPDEVSYYALTNPAVDWGPEYIYQFTIDEALEFNLTLTAQSGDIDFFLLDGLTIMTDASFRNFGSDQIANYFLDAGIPNTGAPEFLQPGTYYLSCSEFGIGATGTFSADISLQTPPPPPEGVWDEDLNGGGDAGDFPTGDFQMSDGSDDFMVIEGDNGGGDIDSYLICVTDAANFFIEDVSGTDTLAFCWDMGGNPLFSNDDNPLGTAGFSCGFGDANTHPAPGAIIGTPATVADGDLLVLSVGGFGSVANGDAFGSVFLAAPAFADLVGPSGENFVDYTPAGGGAYSIQLNGAKLAGDDPGGCPMGTILGDVTGDGEVSLLDVAPFVDLVVDPMGFSCEGDITEDGVVDLLDVQPFVAILTGG